MEGPLHQVWVEQPRAVLYRVYALLQASLLLAVLYYRATTVFSDARPAVLLARVTLFAAEILASFLWVLGLGFRWRPVSRTVFPERLPPDVELPPIDVFVCTADPEKEAPVDVMNTVISALSLDYPPEKLRLYLSDDAGSQVTLFALKEAYSFASSWLRYCKKNRVATRAPEAYFSGSTERAECGVNGNGEVKGAADEEKMKVRPKTSCIIV
ncbi:cellulose synthase-like protein G3 [Aristolochia californica]|uniref:cellulose synthase-like protein G3 n=1 Tax=Aristolochia californica TaxID=171875 RepID=UPI0035DAA747